MRQRLAHSPRGIRDNLFLPILTATALSASFVLATEPDAATARWWKHVQALAGDENEGRDTGSAGYRRAEDYVIAQFTRLGLKPAGTDGFRQPVPMNVLKLDTTASSLTIHAAHGDRTLHWLRDATLAIHPSTPQTLQGDLLFAGDPATLSHDQADGKILVTLGRPRLSRASGPPMPSGAAAILVIDSLAGPEPPRWPAAYAVSYTLAETPTPPVPPIPLTVRINPAAADTLFAGSAHAYAELKALSESGKPVPNVPLDGTLAARLMVRHSEISSDNILAVLPGSDPALRDQYLVLSAHLDGYGIGEPWRGDAIYNGAFDDAAYVATLLDLAQSLIESHTALKRSVLFCIVTGEEKGLLGSKYFAAHPTVPRPQLIADLNLDQLRPIFPLRKLTVLALHDSTLGAQAEQVAAALGIRVQPDPEPERNLLMRSDHWSFMQIGVPALNFVFGYDKRTQDEATYRAWYAERYHSPADDLNQPWLPSAAAQFNRFYGTLVKTVANAPDVPRWTQTPPRPTAH